MRNGGDGRVLNRADKLAVLEQESALFNTLPSPPFSMLYALIAMRCTDGDEMLPMVDGLFDVFGGLIGHREGLKVL
jgi:hypothetical protein